MNNEIKFSLNSELELNLITSPNVFTPNATTNLLIDAVKDVISEGSSVLDLGCGTGAVGIALHLQGLVLEPLCASDLSKQSVLCSRDNFERYNCVAEVHEGSLFEPWMDRKFDVIVDDISGIAQKVAEISPWFQGIPCDTGNDGVDLVVDIISNASKYMEDGGHFFFPVLSLSNVDRILQAANENFENVERVGKIDWPLPKELKAYIPLLRELSKEGAIKLEEKFGMILCYTEVYCATNPIK